MSEQNYDVAEVSEQLGEQINTLTTELEKSRAECADLSDKLRDVIAERDANDGVQDALLFITRQRDAAEAQVEKLRADHEFTAATTTALLDSQAKLVAERDALRALLAYCRPFVPGGDALSINQQIDAALAASGESAG
jgi:hypothetical protein